MTETKRYWFFKMEDDFFGKREIKKLRKIAGGDTFTIIYLKLVLLSLKQGGKIFFEGVEKNIQSELALVLDETEENISVTWAYLEGHNMISAVDDNEFSINDIGGKIKSECSSAMRVRKCRELKKVDLLQCNNDVTISNGEIDTEIESEKEIKKEKEPKTKYLEFVYLTDDQYNKLKEQFGEQGTKDRIENLNIGIGSKGYKYSSHYHTILSWERKNNKSSPPPQERINQSNMAQSMGELSSFKKASELPNTEVSESARKEALEFAKKRSKK